MMHKTIKVALAVVIVAFAWSSANAWTINFENGKGNDLGAIASGIPGLAFTTTDGYDWLYLDASTGNYNTSSEGGASYNGGYYWHGGDVAAFLGFSQGAGRIDFTNQDGSFFQTGYTAGSNFYLEAYDAGGNLIDASSGSANRRYIEGNETGMGYLSVSSASANIAYVMLHDTGNYWIVDNMSGDASGVPDQGGAVPEPATLLLFGLGLVGGAVRNRMKK